MTYKVDVLRLKTARLQNGYSQAALASKSGVAFATVSLLETEKTCQPHPKTIKKICDALNVPVAEIYKLEA